MPRMAHLRKVCRQREKFDGNGKAPKGSGKGTNQNADTCYCCGQPGHRKPDCGHRNETCSTCGKKSHASQVCCSGQSSSASARAVESDDVEDDQTKEVHDVWALEVCTSTEPTIGDDNFEQDSGLRCRGSADRQRLGELQLHLAHVRLRSADA